MVEGYRIKNWQQFQHYKDRNPAWIKLHFAILASDDWVMLDDACKLLAVVCMLVASRHDGWVPNKPAYLKRVAYLDQAPDLAPLISCGFLEIPQADASTPQADARPEERRGEDIGKRREEKKDAVSGETGGKPPQIVDLPAGEPDSLEAQVYKLGKQVLGANAGGMITKLHRHFDSDWLEVRETLQIASRKGDPREYVAAILKPPPDPLERMFAGAR